LIAIHDDLGVGGFHFAGEGAVIRIILKQMCVLLRIEQVIDRHDFQLTGVFLDDGLGHLPANPAETIDTNFCCHTNLRIRVK
jgi:hypothetical protein